MASIGRYEIKHSLTGGGMADVYVGHDPNFDRDVVVKVIKTEYSHNEEFRIRFSREAKVIARLEHEAIVPVYDFGEHNGQPFIVMRCMTGGTLADRLEAGPLEVADAAGIIARIASALDYAHSHGVIHRDLKPANILFDDRGVAYLSDFGIAKSAEAVTNLTGTAIIGTPAYMSPEQARAMQDLDKRSDVYSLGVLIFQLLTGELPYQAHDPVGLLMAHASDPVPDIRKLRSDLPRDSDEFIRRAMAKKPDDRYQTTGDLARDFNKLATRPAAAPRWKPPARPDTPPPVPKPKTPPAEPGPTLRSDDVSRAEIPRPRRPAWGWALPTAFVVFAGLAVLAAGLVILPGLLARGTTGPSGPAVISTPAPSAALAAGPTETSPVDGMVLVYVPEGDFLMGSAGSAAKGYPDEQPQHTVYLSAFWIDRVEVTNGMYARCAKAGACGWPQSNRSATRSVYYGNSQYDNYPVVYVSWSDAANYCRWAGRRLPTEAEWEKAARGTDGRLYPWGSEPPDNRRLNFNSQDTADVSAFPSGASPYGVLDMAGNVWEWVSDWYDPTYYAHAPARNPMGPDTVQGRVLRGGAWVSSAMDVRAAVRLWSAPENARNNFGFRCARSP
jgi:formylglycine-generating enzyme required for sulfatase activity/tRNA A-37 threonylcarbamoyl transferase component Bud32